MNVNRSSILVATDFEAPAMRALEVAQNMARSLDADLILLHVLQPPVFSYPDMPPELVDRMFDELGQAARKALDDLAASAGGVATLLRHGRPDKEILAAIDETHPKMVFMGTHGRRGVKRLILGSVAESVVRTSPVPVVTVRAAEPASAAAA